MHDGTCSTDGCERPIHVKSTGECSTCQSRRYRRDNPGKGRTAYVHTCEQCDETFETQQAVQRFCSLQCCGDSNRIPLTPLPTDHPVRVLTRAASAAARLGPLRAALRDGHHEEVIRILLSRTSAEGSCRIWTGRTKNGYPLIELGEKRVQVHRLMLEAKHGAPLGTQAAHHRCATPSCINPEHLQPVTHRENMAEMLARRSYLARITELEEALAALSPAHPLLRVISVA